MVDSTLTIVIDDREKKPYSFNRFPVETETRRLKTADYCIEGDGREMGGASFDPHYGIERKSAKDFLNSITWERERFEEELARADTMTNRMPVVIEKPLQYFMSEKHYANVGAEAIAGTLEVHPEMFYVEYFFNRDRQRAQQLTYEFLRNRHRKLLERSS